MTITREQLELAAKAAGIDRSTYVGWYWSPLTNHGDLLDLAMACKIVINPLDNVVTYRVTQRPTYSKHQIERYESTAVDCQDFPALSAAIITAAAEQQLAKEKKG